LARQNPPFLNFTRGLISPKALARVDVERTRLSAEIYENMLPSTQGSMSIRPGTKWFGSSLNDTGAEFIEFVASTDDVALVELTHNKMRVWLGDDAHELALLGRPDVDTTVSINDTGWSNASTGGAIATASADLIPLMTAATTNGVTVSASSEHSSGGFQSWKAADDNTNTLWLDTGAGSASTLPSWWKIDFGAGNTKAVASYSIRAYGSLAYANPSAWTLQYNDVDTGAGWTTVDSRSAQTGWGSFEKRSFTRIDADTGTVEAFQYWRLNFTATEGPTASMLIVSEIEMFAASSALQVRRNNGIMTLNATSIGALAKATKRVVVSDTGTEHSLSLHVSRGPVTLRVGSTSGDDDYVGEASLGTGYHNLAFTPTGNFHITVQSDALVDRIIQSIAVGDSGTVELTAPWEASDLANIRYDQSADVVYVDCAGVRPSKIERRGTGRSWSVVDYAPDNGPFLPSASSSAKLSVSHYFGNTTLNSDRPLFQAGDVGSLVRIFHEGQSGQWRLGALDAKTDAIEITGISDTGAGTSNERYATFTVTGSWAGTIIIERSFEGPDFGFNRASVNNLHAGVAYGGALAQPTDTGSFVRTPVDRDDNIKVWYRARITAYTSGVAVVTVTYESGGTTGAARITGYNSNTDVSIEVLSRFSDTGPSDNWQFGYWSEARGFPTAVALHGGRLAHATGGSLFLSVSDDYENFDDETEGDAGPIIKTLGSGPVDTIRFLISKLRLIIGTVGSELALASSSLDEPVTPTNSSARTFSTQGSTNLRAVPLDTRALHVQRSGARLMMIGPTQSAFGDYESSDLTVLVPDLMKELGGIVSIAVQRQPDTRIHCVGANGKVAIFTYDVGQEVLCWTTWSSDTGTAGTVEKAMVLPGTGEDAVYYHVRRTINGATKRYLEKWAKQSETTGDTGLNWLMDCARSYTDTGRVTALVDVATHLVGESVVAWGSIDSGSYPHVDLSPDVNGVQTRYTVDTGGDVTLSVPVHHAVVGLPFRQPTWKSSKLAYAAEQGTALAQMKRASMIAFALYKTHNNGLFFGNDTGHLDPLPRVIEGAVVDADQIHQATDQVAMPFPGLWDADSRIVLRGKSPRPLTVLAAIPSIQTNEKPSQ
jgi:hypothetical protein